VIAHSGILTSWTRNNSARCFEQVRSGAVDIDAAIARMRHMPFEDLGFAKVDHHRALRHGIPEVIFARARPRSRWWPSAERLLENSQNVLITRADRECAAAVVGKRQAASIFRSPA